MSILDEAAKVPKDGQPHRFTCPLCGEQAVGRVDPGNDHTIAACKCTPWAHRTWSQNNALTNLCKKEEHGKA